MATPFTIDRKTASELLNVSERTLDRYIRDGKLTIKRQGRKVFLSEKEIQRLSAEVGTGEVIDTVAIVDEAPKNSTPSTAKEVAVRGDIYMNVENVVYKDLFQRVTKELQHKDDDIKMLNYKLGKLETQIKNTVPLLDFRRSEDSLSKIKEKHQSELAQKDVQLDQTTKLYQTERINKFIYLSILGAFTTISIVTWILQMMLA